MKSKCKIGILIFIVILIVVTAFFYNKLQSEKEIIVTKEKALPVIQKKLENEIKLEEVTLSEANCNYGKDNEDNLIVYDYTGIEDIIVIPEEIDKHKVNKIEADAFVNCNNVEMVKVPTELKNAIDNLQDFEQSETLSNEEYIVYITTKDYTPMYLNEISNVTEEDTDSKNGTGALVCKFQTPIDKVYDPNVIALYSSANADNIPTSYDLREHIGTTVQNKDQGPTGLCYAFAECTSIETNLALQNKINDVNLSEVHLAVMSNQFYAGGYYNSVYNYLYKGYGPVIESRGNNLRINGVSSDLRSKLINVDDDSDDDVDIHKTGNTYNMNAYAPDYYVMKFHQFPYIGKNYKDKPEAEEVRKQIKTHIMTYGSVAAFIDATGLSSNPPLNYTFCETNERSNPART